VEQYLIFAEGQARRRIPMTMNDWIEKLHGFLNINDREILKDAGKISHDLMMEVVDNKYSEYKKIESTKDVEFDDEIVKVLDSVKSMKSIKKRIK
jgi:hypothetical protein